MTGVAWARPRLAPGLDAYGDPILDFSDPRRRPGRPFCLLTLRPRPHGAPEDDVTAVGFHRDTACVDLGAPPEGFLDLVLDFARPGPRLETDRVDDALDAIDPADRPLRLVALIIPLYLSFARDPSLVHDHLDVLAGERQSAFERGDGAASDLPIRSLVCPGKAYLDVVRQAHDTGHAFRGGFGVKFVHVVPYEPGQRDDAVFHCNGDVGRIDARIPPQFVLDVPLDIAVRPHITLLLCALGNTRA